MAGKRAHTVRSAKPTHRQRRKARVKNVPESHRPDAIEITHTGDDKMPVRRKRDRRPANDDYVDSDLD